jgi:N-acyl homoserine lactone hydrolase
MTRIHALRTGSVRIRPSQRERRFGGLPRVLIDTEWTEWLPIYAWVIEHSDGLILVDVGETARTSDPGYFPRWHPYYRRGVKMNVSPEEEIGPQLRSRGISRRDIRCVVLTHLHTDHTGGLHDFPNTQFLVSGPALRAAYGLTGRMSGYLPHHWPEWFRPNDINFIPEPLGPFSEHCPVTDDGSVVVVPTPGHTPHHVSVVVRTPDVTYFIAGDASYTQGLMLSRTADGVAPRARTAKATHSLIRRFAAATPTVYLPSHDPESEMRLATASTVAEAV